MRKDAEFDASRSEFYHLWLAKLLRTFISVKLWTLVAVTWLATWLLIKKLIDGTHWTTIIISGVVAIVLSRSAFQIATLKNGNNHNEEKGE